MAFSASWLPPRRRFSVWSFLLKLCPEVDLLPLHLEEDRAHAGCWAPRESSSGRGAPRPRHGRPPGTRARDAQGKSAAPRPTGAKRSPEQPGRGPRRGTRGAQPSLKQVALADAAWMPAFAGMTERDFAVN